MNTEPKVEELKPCPFCGKTPMQFSNVDAYRCGHCGKNSGWMSKKEWNSRPDDPAFLQLKRESEALRKLRDVAAKSIGVSIYVISDDDAQIMVNHKLHTAPDLLTAIEAIKE